MVDENTARYCECRTVKETKRMLKESGLDKAFQDKTFNNFIAKDQTFKKAKELAKNYAENFEVFSQQDNHSIAFLGQVGAGKTHLSIAIGRELIKKRIPIIYMQYRIDISRIKMNMIEQDFYYKQIRKFQEASVLIIDDLYKGKINNSDINIIFEIINYRYLNKLPLIISSEKNYNQILDFDEAIGTRIMEMCKERSVIFNNDARLNYRIMG